MMHNSILVEENMNNEESRLNSQRMNQEICQRFVRLSCHKMINSRGCGTNNLRRNLLILHLLQKARKDMKQVPIECQSLLQKPIQPPPSVNMRRSGSARGSPVARKPLIGRSLQPQQTTPKKWPFNAQRPTIDTNIAMTEENTTQSTPQPISPPPVDENLKLAYQALDDDDVFVTEEKENKEDMDSDLEELFLKKVGKSISPPVSPEKPQKTSPIEEHQTANSQMKARNSTGSIRRLDLSLSTLQKNTTGRNFFGIPIPDPKPPKTQEVKALSDSLTGKIKSTPIQMHGLNFKEDKPPCLFIVNKVNGSSKNDDRLVPTRLNRNSVSLCLVSEDLKSVENEEYYATDGDYTEEEDETDSELGPRFPSFKRRLRKRKTFGTVRNTAVFFHAEKRAKDTPELLMLTNVRQKHQDDLHIVPSISI